MSSPQLSLRSLEPSSSKLDEIDDLNDTKFPMQNHSYLYQQFTFIVVQVLTSILVKQFRSNLISRNSRKIPAVTAVVFKVLLSKDLPLKARGLLLGLSKSSHRYKPCCSSKELHSSMLRWICEGSPAEHPLHWGSERFWVPFVLQTFRVMSGQCSLLPGSYLPRGRCALWSVELYPQPRPQELKNGFRAVPIFESSNDKVTR